ncbi:MAG: transposase [Burkholderiales bacterium]|nr:transposase [Burkholderiales bacterium]MDE2277793.1 transposase [Burkholderiales bacterium]
MARLPRLVLAGQAHLVVQRGHGAQAVFADEQDRAAYLAALHEAARAEQVTLHAWALLDGEVLLLATPGQGPALGRMVQAIGRRYVSAYNRRHGHKGTLWDGRFRCAVVEPGDLRLAALRWVDGRSPEPGLTSASHRTGGARAPALVDPPEVWALGNTPFEREAAYRTLLAQGLPPATSQALQRAAFGGWALGSDAFMRGLAVTAARPTQPRPRGRPRKRPAQP